MLLGYAAIIISVFFFAIRVDKKQ